MAQLTRKQKAFCREYLVDLNAAQAAIRAGYSPRTAKEMGYENLTKPHIKEHIDAAIKERAERTGITADRVLQELALLGFSSVGDYHIDDEGNVVITGGPDAVRALSSIKKKTRHMTGENYDTTEHDVELRLWNKPKALDMLCRHLGLYDETPTSVNNTQVNIFLQQQFGSDALPEF